MLKKAYSKTGRVCRVTFNLPSEAKARTAYLCGEFNEWNETTHPMKQLKDGSFSLTLSLEPGKQYRFRYYLDGERWENDWEADAYFRNPLGTDDSIVTV